MNAVLTAANVHNFLPCDGTVELFPQRLPSSFDALMTQTPWQQDTLKLMGQVIPLPRLTAWYGTGAYTYSGITMQPLALTPLLQHLQALAERYADTKFNSVLLNLYRSGSDSVAWHSDDEPELGEHPTIASLSFGGTRKFSLKHKTDRTLKPVSINLTDRSVLVMRGACQQHWLHSLPKTRKLVGARINLTFRWID